MDEIRRRESAQVPFEARLRRHALRPAIDDRDAGRLLCLRRQQRPAAHEASADVAAAAAMTAARTAPAACPQWCDLGVELADRRESGLAMLRLLLRPQAPPRYPATVFRHDVSLSPNSLILTAKKQRSARTTRAAPFPFVGEDKRSRSRGAHASELWQQTARKLSPPKNKGRQSAGRRKCSGRISGCGAR